MMSTQQRIYQYIQDYVMTHGYSPSLKELEHTFGVAPNTIRYHLDHLEAIGRITRRKSACRGIRLSGQEIPRRIKGLPQGSWMPRRQKPRKQTLTAAV